jgi:hypothetical protein
MEIGSDFTAFHPGYNAEFCMYRGILQSSGGFSRNEIIRLQKIVGEHQMQLREAWNAYFHG